MGTSTDAILAYGYDLGGSDGWKIHETDEYGCLDPARFTWYDEENDDDFQDQAERHLLNASGFTETYDDGRDGYFAREREAKAALGVQLETYCKDDYPMYVLAAKAITVSRGDSELLDLAAMSTEPMENGWDDKLSHACQVLGITPTQERPGWVLVSYWG